MDKMIIDDEFNQEMSKLKEIILDILSNQQKVLVYSI